MTIIKPYTFNAGEKARANEVNENFDRLYQQVNTNIEDIARARAEVTVLGETKANLHGDATEKFAVGDAVASGDAVNKRTAMDYISNTIELISGLSIERDTNSPNDTIIVNPGSAWDSTKYKVLTLTLVTSKQRVPLAPSTTYYVFICGRDDSNNTTIVIDDVNESPSMPEGYTLYRLIGNLTTDSNGNIYTINSFDTNKQIDGQLVNYYIDLGSGTSATTYTADLYNHLPKDGATYMIYLVGRIRRVDGDNNALRQKVWSDVWFNMPDFNEATQHDNNIAATSYGFITIPARRYVWWSYNHKAQWANLYMVGYRRVGTNS